MKRAYFPLLIPLILSCPAPGAVIHVDAASAGPGDGSVTDPFIRIQDAIDVAPTGDTVLIHPGTYTGAGNYELSPGGRDIRIQSIDPNDPAVVASTIIDPNFMGGAFDISGGETSACIIAGLTITNGDSGRGGGLYCSDSSPTVDKCVFVRNTAALYGGAMYLYNSAASISDCVIVSNSASTDGGGIEWWNSNFTISNCIIRHNQANGLGQGGGIDIVRCPEAVLINCTIAANESGDGAGLYCWASTVHVENCILWDNIDSANSQIDFNSSSSVSVAYSDVQGGWQGDTNIDIDPDFAEKIADSDFHLLSEWGRWDPALGIWVNDDQTSPCIDAGNPDAGWDAETWPHGRRVNMGAYGATGQASMNGNKADFNVNGRVDFGDLAELIDHWLADDAGITNLDSTGLVDLKDAAIFADNWLWNR
ncbi:MAG: right-handed parallel beta-helix repeat-containing protein [Planctomycetes bacterium]|nr:right-handed parallel beta-helix repeat-containing protein [Planctomycetota bacterium]